MNRIHISLNELENTSYKALESLKYDGGFCVALSKDLTFLECVGLHGISQFVEFLLSYHRVYHQDKHFTTETHGTEKDPIYTFDCNNMSCIHFLEPCIEYIASLVNTSSHFTVRFQNSYDYIFLIFYLQKFSPIPVHIQWHDKRKKRYNTSFIFPGNEYPEFFLNVPKNLHDQVQGMLVAPTSAKYYKSVQSQYARVCSHIGVEECAKCFQKSIEKGVFVAQDEWNVIQTFEKSVLVSNNDVSRRGAGELVNTRDSEDLLFEKI